MPNFLINYLTYMVEHTAKHYVYHKTQEHIVTPIALKIKAIISELQKPK